MQLNMKEYKKTGEQYLVDAFSNQAFKGNPAAVVFEHRDDKWMQSVATENNLAETAFIKARKGSSSDFDLRW
jgi:PhzF family phenazine biosynthesis protein